MWRAPILLLVLQACAVGAFGQERGTVVAIHVTNHDLSIPAHHGGDGVVATDAVNVKYILQVYRIETAAKFYELEDGRKPRVALGDVIDFRVEKGKAIVVIRGKECKLRIIGEELKPKPVS